MTTITENTVNTNWRHTLAQAFKNHGLIQILGGLLVIQLLAAAVIGFQGLISSDFDAPEPLFSFAKDTVTELEISDVSQTVQLLKRDDAWVIGTDKALPADNNRVESLLSSLENLNAGLPVASSKNAQAQLEVDDDEYQRKLSIKTGDANTTLLLGTSPGIRKSHVRLEGSDNIHSASLPVSDVPTSVDSWLDKSLLAVSGITKISTNDVTFELGGEEDGKSWAMVDGDSTNSELDTDKLIGLVNSLENLQVNGVADKLQLDSSQLTDQENDSPAEQTDNNPTAPEELISVELLLTTDSTEITLNMQRLGDKATVHRTDIDGYYAIPTTLFDSLLSLGSKSDWIAAESDSKDSE